MLLKTFQFKIGRKVKLLEMKRTTNKKKRKKLFIRKKKLLATKKTALKWFVFLFSISTIASLGTGYLYYQTLINLSSRDKQSILKGYSLLREFEQQIEISGNQSEEQIKTEENIRHLATKLASFGTVKASLLNSSEGQGRLNRYYNSLSQLGINTSQQVNSIYGNVELVTELLADAERAIKIERTVFSYYKVDENRLYK
ncbi:hypothetical protein BCR26_02895 [Enterococcus rivorum]|uniref:Uncharacterized protein n=2 Tax=Enterococcus rivorum TaxID=762845 RepID=A0A1E5KX04_9ENTE|nr:hypothetical protein BCR26_02895 [Enterococcus rivorum]